MHLQALTAEEVRERQQRLAKLRAVMLRHQDRARHLAKIKSKDHHRRSKRADARIVSLCLLHSARECSQVLARQASRDLAQLRHLTAIPASSSSKTATGAASSLTPAW